MQWNHAPYHLSFEHFDVIQGVWSIRVQTMGICYTAIGGTKTIH